MQCVYKCFYVRTWGECAQSEQLQTAGPQDVSLSTVTLRAERPQAKGKRINARLIPREINFSGESLTAVGVSGSHETPVCG